MYRGGDKDKDFLSVWGRFVRFYVLFGENCGVNMLR